MNKEDTSNFKAGFANIIGLPNVGKSTLMNILIGEKLSIITRKAQTTRHRILGIVNEENYQIIFSDTPGYIEKPAYKMQESMNDFVNSALKDADVYLFMVEFGTSIDKQKELYKKLQKTDKQVLLLVNKIDLSKNENATKAYVEKWQKILPKAETFIISALNKFNIQVVVNRIKQLIPVHPPYYDKDAFTDKSERFFVSEIVREKLLLLFKQEIPYSCEVDVESFKEAKDIIRISAIIYTERPTQKSIIIGKGGVSIKKLGTMARKDIEKFFGKKVFIELFVKVKEKWRNSENDLKKFGY